MKPRGVDDAKWTRASIASCQNTNGLEPRRHVVRIRKTFEPPDFDRRVG
jgi:hypothetical protein